MSTNELERRRWNDEHWAAVWPTRERLTSAVTDILLERVRATQGERVLDVGSGGGMTSIAVAGAVGDTGRVLGADISAPLVEFARERVTERGVRNLTFAVLDVQQDEIPDGPYDVVMSQFGVMFFDEPVRAFANLHRHSAHGARLAFACWQPADRNLWWPGHAVAPFVDRPAPLPPGKSPAGPFALGDADRTTGILAEAGWSGIAHTRHELTVQTERAAIAMDRGQLEFMGLSGDRLDGALAAIDAHLDGLRVSDGSYPVELAFQIFTAAA